MTNLQVEFGGHSTPGVKPCNQDAFACCSASNPYKGAIAAVADGVSSSARSEEASQLAVTHFINDYLSTPDSWSVQESASRVIQAMNSWLYHNGGPHLSVESLVTTFSCLVVKSRTAHLFHVGDSRIYLIRGEKIEQLTHDHFSQVAKDRTALTRALGLDSHLKVDHSTLQVHEGDLFMLTTDGVHDSLTLSELQTLIQNAPANLERLGESIANHALKNGSSDNLSCLFLRVENLPSENLAELQQEPRIIPPILQTGNVIDDYEVIRVLHSSPRSHLYLVRERSTEHTFVLKAPSPNFEDDPQYLQSFVREQWIGLRVDHPNVMKVVPRPANSRFMYNLFEYLPQGDLNQWILDNPNPSIENVRIIAEQISSGLRAFQRLSMVHRDLKPDNVMLDEHLRVRLIDFGTVQVAGLEELKLEHQESRVGSINYMAPEYIFEQPGMYRSDIFSLGILVYEMLCGKTPFNVPHHKLKGQASYDLWHYTSIRELRPDLPVWIDLCLQRATSPKPEKRYQALSEFMHDLSTPNSKMLSDLAKAPLIERHPLRFWQGLSAILGLALLLLLLSSEIT